jgi:hypothetical protein
MVCRDVRQDASQTYCPCRVVAKHAYWAWSLPAPLPAARHAGQQPARCAHGSAGLACTVSVSLSPKYSGPASAVRGGGGNWWPASMRA